MWQRADGAASSLLPELAVAKGASSARREEEADFRGSLFCGPTFSVAQPSGTPLSLTQLCPEQALSKGDEIRSFLPWLTGVTHPQPPCQQCVALSDVPGVEVVFLPCVLPSREVLMSCPVRFSTFASPL